MPILVIVLAVVLAIVGLALLFVAAGYLIQVFWAGAWGTPDTCTTDKWGFNQVCHHPDVTMIFLAALVCSIALYSLGQLAKAMTPDECDCEDDE